MTLRNSTNRHVNVFKREPEKTSVDRNKRVVLLNRNFLSFSFFVSAYARAIEATRAVVSCLVNTNFVNLHDAHNFQVWRTFVRSLFNYNISVLTLIDAFLPSIAARNQRGGRLLMLSRSRDHHLTQHT